MKHFLISIFIGGITSSLIHYFLGINNGSMNPIITIVFAGITYIYLFLYKNKKRKKRTFLQDKLKKKKS